MIAGTLIGEIQFGLIFDVGFGGKFEPTVEMVSAILVELVSNHILLYHRELWLQE